MRRRGQAGDPAFLAGVQWCIGQRCKILGIISPPSKTDVPMPSCLVIELEPDMRSAGPRVITADVPNEGCANGPLPGSNQP